MSYKNGIFEKKTINETVFYIRYFPIDNLL
jgi:hypothetical protein